VIDIGGTHIKVTAYQGICRFVYFLPFSAVCWLAGPIITPSLIMSTTFMAFIEFRKKILFALHAAKIRARAACIAVGAVYDRPGFFVQSHWDPERRATDSCPGTPFGKGDSRLLKPSKSSCLHSFARTVPVLC